MTLIRNIKWRDSKVAGIKETVHMAFKQTKLAFVTPSPVVVPQSGEQPGYDYNAPTLPSRRDVTNSHVYTGLATAIAHFEEAVPRILAQNPEANLTYGGMCDDRRFPHVTRDDIEIPRISSANRHYGKEKRGVWMTLALLRRIPKSDVREVEASLIRFLVHDVALGCMNVGHSRSTDERVKKRKLGDTFAAALGIQAHQGEHGDDHETDSESDDDGCTVYLDLFKHHDANATPQEFNAFYSARRHGCSAKQKANTQLALTGLHGNTGNTHAKAKGLQGTGKHRTRCVQCQSVTTSNMDIQHTTRKSKYSWCRKGTIKCRCANCNKNTVHEVL